MKPANAIPFNKEGLEGWEWEENGVLKIELSGPGILPGYAADSMAGQFVDRGHYALVVDRDCDIYRPGNSDALSMFSSEDDEDRLLLSFRKGVIPLSVCKDAATHLRGAAKKADNRGLASGKIDPSRVRGPAQGRLVMLGGSGTRARYLLEDGTVSKVDIANLSHSGVAGYFNAEERHPFCRQTGYTKSNPGRTEAALPYLEAINACFKAQAPNRWAAQKKFVDGTGIYSNGWTLGDTVFTTITVNRNWRTAAHKDAGDFPQGFGNLTVIEGDPYEGGYTGFPQYRVAVDVRTGDFLAMDVHQWHCNTEIAPLGDDYERISVVCYARVRMQHCESKAAEHQKYVDWKSTYIGSKAKAALNREKHKASVEKMEEEVAYLKELFGEE